MSLITPEGHEIIRQLFLEGWWYDRAGDRYYSGDENESTSSVKQLWDMMSENAHRRLQRERLEQERGDVTK